VRERKRGKDNKSGDIREGGRGGKTRDEWEERKGGTDERREGGKGEKTDSNENNVDFLLRPAQPSQPPPPSHTSPQTHSRT
jgi:hypothetical protein